MIKISSLTEKEKKKGREVYTAMRKQAIDLWAAKRASTTKASTTEQSIIFSRATTSELNLPTSIPTIKARNTL